MANELTPVSTANVLSNLSALDVLDAFLSGRNPRTLRAYGRDLDDFARFLGAPDTRAAVAGLLDLPHGHANAAALGYRAHLTERGLKSATIARRLAALRSVVKCARMLGRVAWALDVEGPRAEPYRDTSGPGTTGWGRLWGAAEAAGDGTKARRDRAILRLLYDRGLRRGELAALDLADVDLSAEAPAVAVVGKGRNERERLTLNARTGRALADWLDARGPGPGALFVRLDRAAVTPGRLSGEGVRLVVRELGKAAGLPRAVRPHGLRHASITEALDMTGGKLRDVAVFSRHRDVKTLMVYDDRRRDVGGDITRLLGGE